MKEHKMFEVDFERDTNEITAEIVDHQTAKAQEKAKKAELDALKWKEFFDAHTKEELYELLRVSKFPFKEK